jgi:uncharacterized protein YbaR (Trm112 family)
MHLLVTDRLACPHCGPAFGLLLLAHAMEHRRVREGHFGCPNCRTSYPVKGGFADFRPPGQEARSIPAPAPAPELPEEDAEAGLRLAAMLGVREGPCLLMLMGAPAAQAERLAAMIPEVEVVALHPETRHWAPAAGVSRGEVASTLPFFSGALRGVALDTSVVSRDALAEPVRVLAPGSRLVLELTPGDDRVAWQAALEGAGLELLLATDRRIVGEK